LATIEKVLIVLITQELSRLHLNQRDTHL